VGTQHQAGSDSHQTAGAYFRLKELYYPTKPGQPAPALALRNVLFGLNSQPAPAPAPSHAQTQTQIQTRFSAWPASYYPYPAYNLKTPSYTGVQCQRFVDVPQRVPSAEALCVAASAN
jgi:hypothetical protein